jgi:hypothetical protein
MNELITCMECNTKFKCTLNCESEDRKGIHYKCKCFKCFYDNYKLSNLYRSCYLFCWNITDDQLKVVDEL